MENTLALLDSGGVGGGLAIGVSGIGIGIGGPMSTEDNLVISSSEASSSSSFYPPEEEEEESGLELGLGLSLGGALNSTTTTTTTTQALNPSPWGQYATILTAKDLPPSLNSLPLSSSSSSSSSLTKINVSAGTKRTADSVSSSPTGVSQVVGWPPVRAYRMNSLVNQVKSSATEESNPTVEESKRDDGEMDESKLTGNGGNKNNDGAGEIGHLNASLFVKVNMDGFPIGRKVDLTAHGCYETLAQTLEEMFCGTTRAVRARRSSIEEHGATIKASIPPKLLNGSSEFVLTYEDKEGDWMLVGDVPWGMFLSSVKRLRIMKTSEVNGLGSRYQDMNGKQQSKPI